VAMTALMLTLTAALVFYLTFKWGYSQPYSAAGLEHEVRERDYFFIASFAAWGIWVGIGLATLMAWIQEALPARRWALSAVVLLAALVPLVGNRLTASRAGETMARDYAHDVLQSVDPYALLVTAGDNDTFPLWYAQEVEGVRKDVSVLVLSLANTDWYLRQLQRRPPEPFAPALAPALYRDRTWPRPASPWMSRFYLDGPADTLPPYLVLPHERPGVRRVPGRRAGGPPAPTGLGRRAVAEQPAGLCVRVRHDRRRAGGPTAGARGAGGGAARCDPCQYDVWPPGRAARRRQL